MSRNFQLKSAPITVIIPTYNSALTIVRALQTIVGQSLLPKEVIIIDDLSLDNTVTLIKSFVNLYHNYVNFRIFLNDKNYGAGHSRNIGIANASYNMIAFLDSDDTWHSEKLNFQYQFMIDNPDCIISGHLLAINDSYNIHNSKELITKITLQSLIFKNYFNTPTVMMRSNNLSFPLNQRYAEDYHLWLHTTLKFNNSYLINLELASVHKPIYGFSGLSSNMMYMYLGEIKSMYSIFRKTNFLIKFIILLSTFYGFLKFIRRILIIHYAKFDKS